MRVSEILKINKAKLINGNDININYFTINTKDLKNKTMFFPLKGKTDGHNYILNGVENGLAGFFIEPGHEDIIQKALEKNKKLIIIEVKNTLKALQELAKNTREKLNIPVIALTGSFGKTSQREMIYSVLKQEFKVLTTKGNLNNHIGMPITLVNYKNEDVILLELGSNHPGEIAFLRNICKPTITLVTNIGTAHIGNFKKIKNTLKEKLSIAKDSEYFLKNMDNEYIKKAKINNNKIIEYSVFGSDISNIILGKKNRYTITVNNKRYKVTINSDVNYLINYSICAFKIGLILEMDIKNIITGISKFKSAPSRMEKLTFGRYIIINDCYNASYETMINGLEYFENQNKKNKIIILGDILEQGRMSRKIHLNIAKYIYKHNFHFEEIHLVGKEMKRVYKYLNKRGFNVFYYQKVDEVDPLIIKNKSVYLKASNGIRLDKLIPKKED